MRKTGCRRTKNTRARCVRSRHCKDCQNDVGKSSMYSPVLYTGDWRLQKSPVFVVVCCCCCSLVLLCDASVVILLLLLLFCVLLSVFCVQRVAYQSFGFCVLFIPVLSTCVVHLCKLDHCPRFTTKLSRCFSKSHQAISPLMADGCQFHQVQLSIPFSFIVVRIFCTSTEAVLKAFQALF